MMEKAKLLGTLFVAAAVCAQAQIFDCGSTGQRLTCAEPDKPNKRFICHATGQAGYAKLSVGRNAAAHQPGVPDGPNSRPDQLPGASGNDVGSGPGLDCECNERVCEDVCTGGAEGAVCDDSDRCTSDGTCLNGQCQPGEPTCVAGAPVDSCNVQTGACDSETGACFTEALPAGTVCGADSVCDGSGSCVAAARVVINEVESSGGVPGDWVELHNLGATPVNLSGWRFSDSDNTHTYAIPAGSVVGAGGYFVLGEENFGFGLGSADSARLFNASGALVDSYSWISHAATTYGRCPNGTGEFTTTVSPTKGAANACTPGGGSSAHPWPGQNAVTTVDGSGVFGTNLSDLFHQPEVLWAVRNDPSTLFKLVWDGAIWTPEAGSWSAGKTLRYGTGAGSPDAEGVTRAELSDAAIYVVAERDNAASGLSRLSILRFNSSATGAELIATHEWNLSGDLPIVGANVGLEAITWIPDTFLVANGFFDEAAGHVYVPSQYPDHGTGVFFVGLEANGSIYAYALDHVGGGFTRIATLNSGETVIKGLSFDRGVGYLWTLCGAGCANRSGVFTIDTNPLSPTFGRFKLLGRFERPSTMPNISNEGIAIAPESQCSGGFKPFWWADDAATGGHSIRADSIPCGAFIP